MSESKPLVSPEGGQRFFSLPRPVSRLLPQSNDPKVTTPKSEAVMANKNPLRGLPSLRKSKQIEKARQKAESQAREKAERKATAKPNEAD